MLLVIFFLGLYVKVRYDNNFESKIRLEQLEKEKQKEKEKQEKVYNNCLQDDIDITLLGDKFATSEKELTKFLEQYEAYVSYEELESNYYFGYKDTNVIYGASLIKLVDALYVLDNNIDINSTLKYSSGYYSKYNKGLNEHKVGDDLKIDDVVRHALAVSDNGAHKMLIDYIGFSKLKSYGKSLGAEVTLSGGDNFGMQTAKDTNIYLTRLYDLLSLNDNAIKFKDYMINNFHSYLSVNNLEVAHKYGYYDYVFHDIGIVFDEKPYTISVLTMYGNKDYAKVINEISLKVNAHHNIYWEEKANYCSNLVYTK